MDNQLLSLSLKVGSSLSTEKLSISTAESCTGGLLSHVLTSISGSSEYFTGGVVAYSNQVKAEVLGVSEKTLIDFGAVSEPTAREMADGVRLKLGTDIGLSTTGVAGPTGGTAAKPVGMVCMGISLRETTHAFTGYFEGDRLMIMKSTVVELLTRLLYCLNDHHQNSVD